MESHANPSPLIIILGQTASGKSALAIKLAEQFNGEIIAADSRTVYKGMDIGTAKPSPEDRKRIQHHLLDVVTPADSFTVADFQGLANQAIADIRARGKVPFLVGGSGLYIDSVIYNFTFRPPGSDEHRKQLEAMSVEELQTLLNERGVVLPENDRNPRHLVRALETNGAHPNRSSLRPHTVLIGLSVPPDKLAERIHARVEAMVANGFIDEVRRLALQYGWDAPAMQAPGYKAFRLYIANQISLEEAKRLFVQYDTQYAKRQKTWFKRNHDISWISKTDEGVDIITTAMNK